MIEANWVAALQGESKGLWSLARGVSIAGMLSCSVTCSVVRGTFAEQKLVPVCKSKFHNLIRTLYPPLAPFRFWPENFLEILFEVRVQHSQGLVVSDV